MHSALLEVFAGLTNIYSFFDSKTLQAVTDTDEEGRQYVADIKNEEKDMRQSSRLSQSFGSILGDIGLYITLVEE